MVACSRNELMFAKDIDASHLFLENETTVALQLISFVDILRQFVRDVPIV